MAEHFTDTDLMILIPFSEILHTIRNKIMFRKELLMKINQQVDRLMEELRAGGYFNNEGLDEEDFIDERIERSQLFQRVYLNRKEFAA
ncbi:MAG: hypothetical protein JXA20_05600 [Spirochaetes bacterium]|nr:hypothetical protein [Spirochaetota bacterium]